MQLRIRNQPRVRLNRNKQAVFADEGARIGVIGGHRRGDRSEVFRQLAARVQSAHQLFIASEALQTFTDALAQLLCSLAGKRQTKNFLRAHVAVGHQPHHA